MKLAGALLMLAISAGCSREPERAFELKEGQDACLAAIRSVVGDDMLVMSAGATIQSGTTRYTTIYSDMKNGGAYECQINRFAITDVRKDGKSILNDVPKALRAF